MTHTRKESYSSLSLLDNCPYRYYQKYVQGNYSNESTLPFEIGTLCHYIMEMKKTPQENVSSERLLDILTNGCVVGNEVPNTEDGETIVKNKSEKILGIKDLQSKYFEIFFEKGRKSNLTYKEKIEIFIKKFILSEEKLNNNEEWTVYATELPFEFEFEGIKIVGKIDLVETNKDGDFRITDYKTSDAPYRQEDLATPMQMYIYARAINEIFNKYPIEFVYDFILLGESRFAMTKGWEKRGEKSLKRIVDKLKGFYETEVFPPKATPLCFWCEFSNNTVAKDVRLNGFCEYYSLWTPENKTFAVNKKWTKDAEQSPSEISQNNKPKTNINLIW